MEDPRKNDSEAESDRTTAGEAPGVNKRLPQPSRDTSTQAINLVLLAFKLWDVLTQHETLITSFAMSVYAGFVDVIVRLVAH